VVLSFAFCELATSKLGPNLQLTGPDICRLVILRETVLLTAIKRGVPFGPCFV